MQQANVYLYNSDWRQEKGLMKFAALSTKSRKTEKYFSKIIFNKDLMDQCLLVCMFLSCHVCVSERIHTM